MIFYVFLLLLFEIVFVIPVIPAITSMNLTYYTLGTSGVEVKLSQAFDYKIMYPVSDEGTRADKRNVRLEKYVRNL